MSSSGSNREQTCVVCGAEVAADAPFCWLCREAIERLEADAAAAAPPPVIVEPRAPLQFGLSTLFLVMTLFAITLSVANMEPGLGICLAVLSLPPVIRTCLVVYRRKTQGRNVTPTEKIGLYLVSFFVTALILTVLAVAGFATFFVVCLGTYGGTLKGLGLGMVIGGIVALVVIGLLCWPAVLWIRHRWRKDVRQTGENRIAAPLQEDEE